MMDKSETASYCDLVSLARRKIKIRQRVNLKIHRDFAPNFIYTLATTGYEKP